MQKLTLHLENCYGIKQLKVDFDFTDSRAYAIYAPNGAMKSSLAQTFKDIADGADSRDRIFVDRKTLRNVATENGHELPKDSVLVVRPYDEVFGHTEKTSTLLVNAKLRKEYEQLHEEIDRNKAAFLKALKGRANTKRDLEKEISLTFTKTDSDFARALVRVRKEVIDMKDAPFVDVPYDVVFDEKVLNFLEQKDFKTSITDYVKTYNELLAASTYFKKGTFTYYNASTIAKSLADNGFFDAKHTVSLNADTRVEITSEKQLEQIIAAEKAKIGKDKELQRKFAEIEKLITKNVSMRDFEAYISDHEEFLPNFANVSNFKEEVWKSYFKSCFDQFTALLDSYAAAEKRKREIEEQAERERTQWETVIEIFNERFFVPFKLTATNRTEVILGDEPMLTLGFTFQDGSEQVSVEKATLVQALSTGEKKALYILNIIFEIEARRTARQETVFVIDDIADSFDYKNKYAIIQYLKDIAEDPLFHEVILTHNFDFFRTVNSRFVQYKQCLMAFRDSSGLRLEQAEGIRNIFVNAWKPNFFSSAKKRLASIPFIRNLVEYTRGEDEPAFGKLTSLLHWKADSHSITQADLDAIFNDVFQAKGNFKDGAASVVDAIIAEAGVCLNAPAGINFENKIVLSIAIRLTSERFMVGKINDAAFANAIEKNQTQRLLGKFKELFAVEKKTIEVLERVMLMTPENIHLNSFMYEPILDMSDEHLKKLYEQVLTLK